MVMKTNPLADAVFKSPTPDERHGDNGSAFRQIADAETAERRASTMRLQARLCVSESRAEEAVLQSKSEIDRWLKVVTRALQVARLGDLLNNLSVNRR
jgi:hypothetical protein